MWYVTNLASMVMAASKRREAGQPVFASLASPAKTSDVAPDTMAMTFK